MTVDLQIGKMTLEEKLRAMEALWDDLCRSEDAIPVQQWQKDLLAQRERLIQEGKARFSPWSEAKKRILDQVS